MAPEINSTYKVFAIPLLNKVKSVLFPSQPLPCTEQTPAGYVRQDSAVPRGNAAGFQHGGLNCLGKKVHSTEALGNFVTNVIGRICLYTYVNRGMCGGGLLNWESIIASQRPQADPSQKGQAGWVWWNLTHSKRFLISTPIYLHDHSTTEHLIISCLFIFFPALEHILPELFL